MYGGRGSSPEICPGEANCEKWASTKGSTHAAKEANVCHPCSMFGTKTDAGRKNATFLTATARRAMHIRRQRLAGYPASLSEMTPAEFQTVIMIEEFIEHEEIGIKRETAELLMAFFKARG